jgi:Tol biopolymer transport system component
MSRTSVVVAFLLPVLFLLPGLQKSFSQQTAGQLYEQGLYLEEGKGELKEAIEKYQAVLKQFSGERRVCAKAQLHIGFCYETLGKDEARKVYERLVRDYADQPEEVKLARDRLAALRKPAGRESGIVTRQVWTGPDMDFEGSPSPDGRYLSFVDWSTGDLAIRNLETGENRRLTDKGPWEKSDEFADFSRWSPDGKQIAYDWYDGKCCVDLHVISLEDGNPRVLVNYEDSSWMQTYDWSPDGKQILTFLEKSGGTRQIVLVSAADGSSRIVKTFQQRGRFPQTMRFSREGHYIAYDQPQEDSPSAHDIFLISADGSQEIPLVKHPADDRLLGWPPDGKGMLFASDRTGSPDMWFLPVSNGKPAGPPELVKAGVEEIVPVGFTESGSFYYAQGQLMLDVYVARMDPKSGKILAPPEKAIKRFEGANSWPAYSPDGKFLAYVTTRSRSFQAAISPSILSIRSLETGKDREFTTEFRRLAGPDWSPDNRFVYVAGWDNQGMGIYRFDRENGESTAMVRAEPPASLHWHKITPDGGTFIYERRDSPKDSDRILSRDLVTGEEKQLYAGDRATFSISPDGRWLALINQEKKKVVQVMPVGGGEPRVLLRFEDKRSNFVPIEWTADGKFILFPRLDSTDETNRQNALWRIPAEGGGPQQLDLVMAGFEDLSAHPDGQHLVFDSPGFTRKRAAIWVMENFLRKEDTTQK